MHTEQLIGPHLMTMIHGATLHGTLDSGGPADCSFEYGLTTGYGTATSTESKEDGESFSQVITGLLQSTLYHFRAIATNAGGTDTGDDATFTTF